MKLFLVGKEVKIIKIMIMAMSVMTNCSMSRFVKNLIFFLYNAALTMTVGVWVTNTEKNYQELRLESLQNRRKL